MKCKLYLMILVSFLCVSCVKFKKQSESNEDVIAQTVSKNWNYKTEYIPESEPGFYSLKIKFQSIPDFVEFSYGDKTESCIKQSEIEINHLKNGDYVFGHLTIKNENNHVVYQTKVEINPPIDLVINGRYELSHDENIKVERLFLNETAQIYNGTYKLNIYAQNIIAEKGALIANFENSQEGKGLSAESIYIQAHQLSGYLNFISQGQNGQRGLNGWDLIMSYTVYLPFEKMHVPVENRYEYCHAQRGGDGGIGGLISLNVKDASKAIIQKKVLESSGGQPGQVLTVKGTPDEIKNYQRPSLRNDCQIAPVMGNPGAKGQICLKLSEMSPNFCDN